MCEGFAQVSPSQSCVRPMLLSILGQSRIFCSWVAGKDVVILAFFVIYIDIVVIEHAEYV